MSLTDHITAITPATSLADSAASTSDHSNHRVLARSSWPLSLDILQRNLTHATPEYKESLIWAFGWCIQHHIHLKEFAKTVGYDPSTILRLINGDYRDPRSGDLYDVPKKLSDAIQHWKRQQLAIAASADINFVITPTVKDIWKFCDLARESRSPAFIYGASHIGKTWALQHYTYNPQNGTTIIVRMPASAGLLGMVRCICQALGISTSASTMALIERIKHSLTPDMLVIFDEVHQLIYTYRKDSFLACLEVLRSIYDHSHCGMILCTTNVGRRKFESERNEALQQLFRRGVHRRQLGDVVLARDLKEILAQHGLAMPPKREQITINNITESPYKILAQLAKDEGLKAITERLRYSHKLAHANGKPVDWAAFLAAHLIIANNDKAPESDWD